MAQTDGSLVFLPFALAVLALAGIVLRHVGAVRAGERGLGVATSVLVLVTGAIGFVTFGYGFLTGPFAPGALLPGIVGAVAPLADFAKLGLPHWLWQIALAVIAAELVASSLAGRMRADMMALFALVFAGFVYPVAASWNWAGGWLVGRGFIDFAGATLVFSAAGWAALAGMIVLGGRPGRFTTHEAGVGSAAIVGLGTAVFILSWLGAVTANAAALSVGGVVLHLALAAGAGLVVGVVVDWLFARRLRAQAFLGLIAGLVALTAEPATASPLASVLVGAGAGLLCAVASTVLERLRLDDAAGIVPAYLVGGVWGTLAAAVFDPAAHFAAQAIGVIAVAGFVFFASLIVFLVLQIAFGLRTPSARPGHQRPAAP